MELAPKPGAGDRGVTDKECVWPLAAEWGPQLSLSKEMGRLGPKTTGDGILLREEDSELQLGMWPGPPFTSACGY